MLPDPVTSYYKITYSVSPPDPFEFAIFIAASTNYTGTGNEFGDGGVSGLQQITAVAEAIASAIDANSTSWNDMTVTSIEAFPTDMLELA